LAATYSQMGLSEKANVYWERVLSLAPAGAGKYYALAERQLRGELPPEEGASDQLMKVGEVSVEEQPAGSDGQRVALRITIDADPATNPSGEELSLVVYFYDLVDGSRIEASTADTSEFYPTEPYDWQTDGTEVIVVNYHQPRFSEEQARELGQRNYYGYVIELYYRDQLQDRLIMPEEISALGFDPGVGNGDQQGQQPENGLFPTIPSY
ncbi:MAG: hypothetical protein AAGC68_09635, partial [Verrucomicrobiota bacterium]